MPEAGVFERLPIKAPQYDISSEGEDRPSDNSHDGEWWPDEVDLNEVTIGNMSIDSKPRVSEVGTEKSQWTPVLENRFVNPGDWPNINLKPSKGSVKGQRYVGPGGEKVVNLGRIDGKSSHRTTRWR